MRLNERHAVVAGSLDRWIALVGIGVGVDVRWTWMGPACLSSMSVPIPGEYLGGASWMVTKIECYSTVTLI